MVSKLPRLSSVLGRSLAYAQHGVDRAVEWAFKGVKQMSRETPQEAAEMKKKSLLRMPLALGRRALFFFGDLGEAFYAKYEELKRKG